MVKSLYAFLYHCVNASKADETTPLQEFNMLFFNHCLIPHQQNNYPLIFIVLYEGKVKVSHPLTDILNIGT